MLRGVFASLFPLVLFLAASPAIAWVEEAVAETEKAANEARCVGFIPLNDMIYVLNAPADRSIMSEAEERTAMIDLTRALGANGRFAVTRGRALSLEASRLANTDAGRRELAAILDRLSEAAITVYLDPYARGRDFVRAEITLLVRRNENGSPILACTPTVRADIPVFENGSGHDDDPPPDSRQRVIAFVTFFHEMANRPGSCIEMGQFYAPFVVIGGQTRSRTEQIDLRCDIDGLNPEIYLDEGSIRVTETGSGTYLVSYSNTSRVDQNGRRVTTDWYVDAVIEDRDGRLQYTRIDLSSRRR